MALNYTKSKIYAIRNSQDDSIIYIGGTVSDLRRRYWNHRCNHHDLLYKLVKDNGINWRYLHVEHIHDYTSCQDRLDLVYTVANIKHYIQNGQYDMLQYYIDNLVL